MYIESVPNRGSPPAILLRESYRDGGKVKKRTLLNLSDWPHERIAGFKMLLNGGTVIPKDQEAITIVRSLPHGHVVATLGTARKIGLDRLLGPNGNRCRDLVLALVVSRILDPGSKLAAAGAVAGHRHFQPWRAARSGNGRRGRALQRPRLAGGPPASYRDGPRQTPSHRRHAGALRRNIEQIAAEAALDGIYVVRTSLPATALDEATAVRSYKSLSLVERAFRCIKTVDLQVRPVYHWLAERVRAHVFLCMLAYYLEWHMRRCLAPLLYDDTDKAVAETLRPSVVAKAERSPAAVTKQTTGRTEDGLPVHRFRTLLADLATLTRNTLVSAIAPERPFTLTARPTPLQQRAHDLLGFSRTQ
jgi:hypothetical protein